MKIICLFFLLCFINTLDNTQPERKLGDFQTPLNNNTNQMSQQELMKTAQEAEEFLKSLSQIKINQNSVPNQQEQNQQPQIPQTNFMPQNTQSQYQEQNLSISNNFQHKKKKEPYFEVREFLEKNKYLCLMKNEYCKIQCAKNCDQVNISDKIKQSYSQKKHKKSHHQIECEKCNFTCQSATNDLCLGNEDLEYDPISKESFYTFRNDKRKCQNIGYVCSKLCFIDHCKDQFSAECAKCKVDCDNGAKQGCFVSTKETQLTNFKKIYGDFQNGKGRLKCKKCDNEVEYYCKQECDLKNLDCLRSCENKANLACKSQCVGSTKHFYHELLIPKIKSMLRQVLGNCDNCQELCVNETKIVCFKEDEACNFVMGEKCKNYCLMKFCDEFRRKKLKKKRERKLLDVSLVGDKFEIILSRAKVHQRLRNFYDDKKELNMRKQAFEYNRQNLISVIQGGEDRAYSRQESGFQKITKKDNRYEEKFHQKMSAMLANPNMYEAYKHTAYGIFEDQ